MKKILLNETKQHIKDAFIRIYLDKEITTITVKDICNEVPISRNTFYNYYDNVYSVYEEIESEILADIDRITIDFSESDFLQGDIKKLYGINEVLDYISEHSMYFHALLRHGGTNGFTYKWQKQIKEKFHKKYKKEISHKAETEAYLVFTVSGITGICEYWINHPEKITKQEILEGVYNMVCHEKRD